MNKVFTKVFAASESNSILILRLVLGITFFSHGAQKLFGWFGGYGWAGTIGWFQTLSIPASLAGLSILVEFFGGIAIILGLLTRPAALGLAINSLVAMITVHWASGFFLVGANHGIEFVFALFMIALFLFIEGAGSMSVDKVISKKFIRKETKVDNKKVVCKCLNVTEQDLKNAIKNGANSFEEVQAVTKVGTGCGQCVESNKALVSELLFQKKIDENQTVCGCMNVTAQDIVKAIKNGAKSFEEVQAVTKVGTGCGQCVESNKALVAYLTK